MLSSSDKRAAWYAWFGWATLFLVTAAIIIAGSNRTVVPSYLLAASNWMAGRGLYDGTGVGGFVYLPQAAILFVPFAMIPKILGEVLWRLINIGTLAVGLRGFAAIAGEKSRTDLFPLMTLVTIPLAWDCARNGQATLIITGLMLLSVVDISRCRWWRATLWLSLGVAVKPLVIVLVLLVMAIDRPMTWRLLLGMGAVALAPFVTQHPTYVLQQYLACLHNTTMAAHVSVAAHGWTSPFTALRLVGFDVPEHVQTVIRVVAALVTLTLCIMARRWYDADRSAMFVFSLAVVYLTLFSPRTENNTYAMLGPSIAVFLALAFLVENRFSAGILLSCIAVVLVGGRLFEHLLAPHTEGIWLSPLMATCFSVYLLAQLLAHPTKRINGENISTASHHEARAGTEGR
jgi:alpha-1,2-mannosyltransferase